MKSYRVVDKRSNILAEGELSNLILYQVWLKIHNPMSCVFIVDCETGETISDESLYAYLCPFVDKVEVI